MRASNGQLELSATDLANFLGCRHRTALDMAVAHGKHARPRKYEDPLLEILWQRGLEHERRYVETLRAQGLSVIDLRDSEGDRDAYVETTLEAMHRGTDVIVQGALRDGRWFGKPDVLRRVALPGTLGAWSYEVVDTKLARETRAGTILQLGLYSEMLALTQGVRPEHFHVVTPFAEHAYRLDEFAAYFRLVRSEMLSVVDADHDEMAAAYYPEPVDHCHICQWSRRCDDKRHQDDHLSLVAGMARLHRRELESRGLSTVAQLAALPLPIQFKPKRGSVETYVRVREQARIQMESRGKHPPLFELRTINENKDEGLCRLPEPSAGDVFLDLEGDAFAGEYEGGREYLFGVLTLEGSSRRSALGSRPSGTQYQAFWALNAKEEREAFEFVIDLIMSRWKAHPDMHVYHYAPYEPAAFKRLMGRYVTREQELDSLLRNERFVDLYGIVRQGLRVGVESYSIKQLEPVYGYERAVRLVDANRSLTVVQQALELNAPETIPDDVREAVRGYNEDDCVSALRLRDWLEQIRSAHVTNGWDIPRPKPPEVEPEKASERDVRVRELRAKLLEDVPELLEERNAEQQARWLLAYLLDYHHREDKAVWWEYFRLRDLPEEDLHDEPQAIAGLEFVERVSVTLHKKTRKPTGTVVDRYRYPPQEMEIERGDLKLKEGGTFGKLVALDRSALTIDVSKGKQYAEHHPASVFAHTYVPPKSMEESLDAIAERVIRDAGVIVDGRRADKVGRSLLLALAPRLTSGAFQPPGEGEDMVAYLKRIVLALDHTVLALQGPPGSGKTYCGGEMICAVVAAGRKVGITATSHKVIRNLLDEVAEAAERNGMRVKLAQRVGEEEYEPSTKIARLDKSGDVARALGDGDAQVVGGTAWVWSDKDLAGSVDVLFVDEAGQMSLANVLAVSPAAKNIVLLGDPRQLEQPRKATHPDGVGISALEHMLAGHKTLPADRGVFLPVTWRLCPKITEFTSEVFYERRLTSKPGLERQRLSAVGHPEPSEGSAVEFDGAGLFVVNVDHDGNRTWSAEEVDVVADLVKRLTAKGVTWTPADGKPEQLTAKDILIVAPYNAHVSRLTERLAGTGARVGTVDKFQGQEAPVVIYSMATSRPEDAPRGMEFLYSVNRLNVATSRAKCAAIVVANERLFEPECRTVRQMRLANALCRYRERALSSSQPSPLALSHRLEEGPR